jgi:EpsD family peptidyl-prolyl cis-trans isomerase
MNPFSLYSSLVLLVLILSACDQSYQHQSQVLATVNDDEISLHQLNLALSNASIKVIGETDKALIMDKLIDRQLVVQQALALKLDRQPEIMMKLENARHEVLAAAYAEYVKAQNPIPVKLDKAAANYFSEHPALFTKRNIYKMREIAVPIDSVALLDLEDRLRRKEELQSILKWLKQQPGHFSDQVSIRPADNLPVEVATHLLSVKIGQTISFKLPRALVIYQIQSIDSSPVDWSSAKPKIDTYLKAQHDKSSYQSALNNLRTQAKILRHIPAPQTSKPYHE